MHACSFIAVHKPPPSAPASSPRVQTTLDHTCDPSAADEVPRAALKAERNKRIRSEPETERKSQQAPTHDGANVPPYHSLSTPRLDTAADSASPGLVSPPKLGATDAAPTAKFTLNPDEPQATMHEYQVVTAAHTKPHALLALLAELRAGSAAARTIIFASAVDAVRRLTNLLEGAKQTLDLRVFEMSSRVASRVQVETLAALQREPSWSVPPPSCSACQTACMHTCACIAHLCIAHLNCIVCIRTMHGLAYIWLQCLFRHTCAFSQEESFLRRHASSSSNYMQCCLLPWPALHGCFSS
jgi:hypothetical protein